MKPLSRPHEPNKSPRLRVLQSFLRNDVPDDADEESDVGRCICRALQGMVAPPPAARQEPEKELPALCAPWHLETLIVTVPNPIETGVGYQFDLIVESLHFAMSTEGFVLDRYRLPWLDYRDRVAVDPKLQVQQSERKYIKQPGVLLFRHTVKKELVLMLLVGESPLSGILKQAFAGAVRVVNQDLLEFVKGSNNALDFKAPSHIDVLGPCFSGSADSMALAISQCAQQTTASFRLVSGSAMNVNKGDFEDRCRPVCARFHATLATADLLKSELIEFVRSHTWPFGSTRIAWLSENTGFGQREQFRDEKVQSDVVTLPFPIHISRVRGTFSNAAQSAQQNLPSLPDSRFRLNIPFEDPQPPRDIVPEFSPSMTATTAELLLNQIMTTIARGRFRFVGITATDARDRIFLAGFVRKFCPDVQLLIIESDLLFAHPQSRSFMKGALVASSYAITQQGRIGPEERNSSGRHLEFSTDYCQGIYNAAIILRHYDVLDANVDKPSSAGANCSCNKTCDESATRTDAGANETKAPAEAVLQELAHKLRGYDPILDAGDQTPLKHSTPLATHDRQQPGIWLAVVGNDELWPIERKSILRTAESFAKETKNSNENAKKPDDFGRAVGYTFATWSADTARHGDQGAAASSTPKPDKRESPLRTHLDAFNRVLFFVVLLVGVYEIIQHAQGHPSGQSLSGTRLNRRGRLGMTLWGGSSLLARRRRHRRGRASVSLRSWFRAGR